MRRARCTVRRLFQADISARKDALLTLALRSGAYVKAVDHDGNVTSETYDPSARLWANVGDQLIISGPTIGETVGVRVVGVRQDGGAIMIAPTYGAIAETTRTVRVMHAGKARAA
jgi:hypothetical protein